MSRQLTKKSSQKCWERVAKDSVAVSVYVVTPLSTMRFLVSLGKKRNTSITVQEKIGKGDGKEMWV